MTNVQSSKKIKKKNFNLLPYLYHQEEKNFIFYSKLNQI